ncbi:MAG: MBG domain-containing protein [Bacteroidaceae bacterium]
MNSYTKSSSSYYYYPYDSYELEDVRVDYYNIRYKVKYPKLESVTLSTYTKTFDITNIEGSYFSGSINGGSYVGGIAGHKVSGSVNRNYSNATISGSDYVGGLVGRLEKNANDTNPTSFDANVAMNPSVSVTGSNAGRVYGSKDANFSIAALGTNNENRVSATSTLYKNGVVQSVSDNLQNGTAVGISQLRFKSNYVAWGWDFNDNWTILETESFPYKVWQTAPPTFSGKLATGATSVTGKSVDGATVTVTTKDAGNTYTTTAPNNTWTVTLSTGLHTGEEVTAYAQKTGLQKSYISSTSAGQIGSGTPEDPYLIYTAYDLAGITKEGNYKVMSDIDLTSWINENSPSTGWEAIGVASVSDSLVIEGDGHKITGLWSKTSSLSDYAGLFSSIAGENSVIRNLTIENVDVDGGNAYSAGLIGNFSGSLYNCHVTGSVNVTSKGKANQCVGLLVGKVDGTVSECSVDGSVTITSVPGIYYAGLLAGQASNTITNCSVNGNVQGAATFEGLITGYTSERIESCEAEGSISGSAMYMGGIVGQTTKNISFCSADVTLTNSGSGVNQYTGGICGHGVHIFKCKVAGIISGPRYAGGLAGYSSGEIRYSLSSGSVSSDRYAGGIAGYGTKVIDCYSTSDVTSTGTGTNCYAGGLVGLGKNTIQNSYATGNVASGNVVAGIVGYLNGAAAKANYCVAINNQVSANSESGYAMRVIGGYTNGAADPEQTCLAYKDMAVSINNVSQRVYDNPLHGTSTTMEALKTQSTYTGLGWDFSSVWYMNAATGLPDLQLNKEKASQTITINPEMSSMTYGAEPVTLPATTDQGMPVSWSSSDTNVAAISGNKIISKGVGSATISYTQLGNEAFSALEGSFSFSVNKAPLTITADSKSMQEGAAVPELTVTYSGFVNNDTEASLTTPPSVTTTATSASPVGSYPITVSGAVSSNYEFTYVNGTLTVVDESADKNKLGGQDISAKSGSQIVLPIELTNEEDITALQLKLILPPHVTIATNAKGRNLIAKTERDEYHTLSCNQQDDGSYIILLYSTDVDLIEGNSGSVIDVTLDIDGEIEEGVYPITLSSITLTRENGSKIYPADATINITISDGLLGDADNDGTVDVADIVVVANYILTNGETPIAFSNADVDGDGIIDVADIVGIANIILNGGNSGVKAREAQDMIDPQ